MSLTPEQREDALTILKNSGGHIPVFHVVPPRPLDKMTAAERAMFATAAADEVAGKIDRFLQNVYDMALLKHHLPAGEDDHKSGS